MKLTDTHSHLYDEAFDRDREEALARAAAEGVGQLLLPAIDSESHERLFGLCRRHPQRCIPMMGLHPTSVNDNPRWRDELALVESYLRTPPEGIAGFCAVGEIGLDLYWSRDFREEQAEAFRRQIDLSLQYGLPIAVHTRDAWPETVAIMREYRGRGVRGVFHAYSDGIETYRKLKECGDFVFGIGGVVTFKKSRLAEVAGEMELRDLVLETDCPYLTPAPHRGERNESAWVRYVCEKVAQIKGLTPEEVAEATTANAERMFGRPQNRPAPSHGRKIFDAPEANRQAAAPPCGGLPATAFRADPRELPPENATEVPENESSDHASPSSDNGLSRPKEHNTTPDMKKIKITVLRKTCHRDLMEQYENPIEHACDLYEGQVFTTDGWRKPDGLCDSAWQTLSPFVMTLAHGGTNIYDGWMKNPASAMISCNDGFRPVSFLIETLEK